MAGCVLVYPRRVVSAGWVYLAAMIAAYGVANLLQSAAAARTTVHHTFDPSLLLRLAGQRTYLLGLLCQVLGFVLAFLARRDLPLFLVQSSMAAGLGVTAILGVLILKWKLPKAEAGLSRNGCKQRPGFQRLGATRDRCPRANRAARRSRGSAAASGPE